MPGGDTSRNKSEQALDDGTSSKQATVRSCKAPRWSANVGTSFSIERAERELPLERLAPPPAQKRIRIARKRAESPKIKLVNLHGDGQITVAPFIDFDAAGLGHIVRDTDHPSPVARSAGFDTRRPIAVA
jgi:hypothetical protein